MNKLRPVLTVVNPSLANKTSNQSSNTNNVHVVQTIESLLNKAKEGKVTGLVYIARLESVDHGPCTVGEYMKNPISALSAFDAFQAILNRNSNR